jgi:Copper resistance protein D
LDHRFLLSLATALHHVGTAAWIGAMPFLLISLARADTVAEARSMARRYSQMALLSVAVLVLAGIYLAWFYVGAWNGLYGTSYGLLLHHWAGLIVFVAGLLAFASRFPAMRWARFWPLAFGGLSIFILLRADPENWPLGPRPFWASFSAPDVLAHRAAALLILCFAVFECAAQAGKLRVRWAALIFPAMCALGAAVLLTHNHAPSDMAVDLLASLSHTPIALLGATAGWTRWLELRLPPSAGRPKSRAWLGRCSWLRQASPC